jgi:hypothetical protein
MRMGEIRCARLPALDNKLFFPGIYPTSGNSSGYEAGESVFWRED